MKQGEDTENKKLNDAHRQVEAHNKSIDMQDRRSGDVVCSKCGRIIILQSKADGMRERTIAEFVQAHTCQTSMQSKRDFEQEVR